MYQNPWGYPPPQTPVMFMPSPGTQNSLSPQTAAEQILAWKQVEKMLKGDEKKPDDKKKQEVSVVGMMLFMLLMSPVTGPIIYWFFQQSAGMIHR